jgi:alkanesulfonate monooxygenase SsuD/methylene tetrahydromethanopterin reductase-like flavin-dependent oxidoreductase (luciferase family)
MIVVADSDAEAEKIAQPAYERWYKNLEHQANSYGFTAAFLTGSFEIARRRVGSVIAGTPETVKNELIRTITESGVNYPLLQFALGTLTHAETMRSFDLFVREVLPAVKAL